MVNEPSDNIKLLVIDGNVEYCHPEIILLVDRLAELNQLGERGGVALASSVTQATKEGDSVVLLGTVVDQFTTGCTFFSLCRDCQWAVATIVQCLDVCSRIQQFTASLRVPSLGSEMQCFFSKAVVCSDVCSKLQQWGKLGADARYWQQYCRALLPSLFPAWMQAPALTSSVAVST